MSKLAHSCDETMRRIEWDAMQADGMTDSDCFEAMHAGGVDEITWDESLNRDYAQWIYFNIE